MNILNKLGIGKERVRNLLEIGGNCLVDDIINGPETIFSINNKRERSKIDNNDRKIMADGIMKLCHQYKMEMVAGETVYELVIRAVIDSAIEDYDELESLRHQVATIPT